MEAVGEELAGKLRFASESVDDPGLRGLPLPPQGYDFRESPDDMEQKRFAEPFAQFEVDAEQARLFAEDFGAGELGTGGVLRRFGAVLRRICGELLRFCEGVEAAFADGADLRFGGKCPQQAQCGGCDAPIVPGVDADGVKVAGAQEGADGGNNGGGAVRPK